MILTTILHIDNTFARVSFSLFFCYCRPVSEGNNSNSEGNNPVINPMYAMLPEPSLGNSTSNLKLTKANSRHLSQEFPAGQSLKFSEPINENELNLGFNPPHDSSTTPLASKAKESAASAKASGSKYVASPCKKDKVVGTGGSEKSKPVVSFRSAVRKSSNTNSDDVRAKVTAQLKKGASGSKGSHISTGVPVLMKQ